MCRFYVTEGAYLGQRLVGYVCYESKSKGFIGFSEKQLIDKLKRGERVYGFVLGKEDDKDTLVLDTEGFGMCNLQVKSGVNSLTWLRNDNSDCDMNIALIVVSVLNEKGKRTFETVNARHARVSYTESKLKLFMEIGVPVAGVKLVDGKIVVCDGVEIINGVEEVKGGAS